MSNNMMRISIRMGMVVSMSISISISILCGFISHMNIRIFQYSC